MTRVQGPLPLNSETLHRSNSTMGRPTQQGAPRRLLQESSVDPWLPLKLLINIPAQISFPSPRLVAVSHKPQTQPWPRPVHARLAAPDADVRMV